jgi:2-polyprenyl-6-methoxyphenol hydroxylase-like FAD-dependent oxidoreductase
MQVSYQDEDQQVQTITCKWLIGADGKKGIVRKHFLEPTAGIKQEDSFYRYDGTWVAANLKISLPTPDTHPQLPFWKLDMTPEQVYELYWPQDWHFCTPPGKPTAAGRFGPYEDRLWRHEFAEHGWNESMDANKLLWEHITPMITYDRDRTGRRFDTGPTPYPKDCLEILRCRPFTFTHKIVNKWFHGRTVLIGDSAHVFPPFGGEGIASGIRDAHQLAWRIALAKTASLSDDSTQHLLKMWAAERQKGIHKAADFTKLNGTLCNEPESWGFFVFRHIEALWKRIPLLPALPNPRTAIEAKGYEGVLDGFFLPEFNGGGKLAQIYLESKGQPKFRSDTLLRHDSALLTLFMFNSNCTGEAEDAVRESGLPSGLLSADSIVTMDCGINSQADNVAVLRPAAPGDVENANFPKAYRSVAFLDRLGGHSTAYAIVRPDFYIFASLKDAGELTQALARLKELVIGPDSTILAAKARL